MPKHLLLFAAFLALLIAIFYHPIPLPDTDTPSTPYLYPVPSGTDEEGTTASLAISSKKEKTSGEVFVDASSW